MEEQNVKIARIIKQRKWYKQGTHKRNPNKGSSHQTVECVELLTREVSQEYRNTAEGKWIPSRNTGHEMIGPMIGRSRRLVEFIHQQGSLLEQFGALGCFKCSNKLQNAWSNACFQDALSSLCTVVAQFVEHYSEALAV